MPDDGSKREEDLADAYRAAEDAFDEVGSDRVGAKLGELVRCALSWAAVAERRRARPAPQPTHARRGPHRALALLSLATGVAEPHRSQLLGWAHEAAREAPRDGRILLAIARGMRSADRTGVVSDAIADFREAERAGERGAAMWLVCLAGLAPRDEALSLLKEAASAAAAGSRPEMLGDLARGIDPFEPLGAAPLPPDLAAELWRLVPRTSNRLRARLAALLPSELRDEAVSAVLEEVTARLEQRDVTAQVDLAVLVHDLEATQLTEVRELLDRDELASWIVLQPLASRHLELGEDPKILVDLVERLERPYAYRRGVASLLRGLPPSYQDTLIGLLGELSPRGAANLIEEFAEELGRALPVERAREAVSGLAPYVRAIALGSLCPFVPDDDREALLEAALEDADAAKQDDVQWHAFIGCAPWLSDADARLVVLRLLGLHSRADSMLTGDDGVPWDYPGIRHLVPLMKRLGGDEAVVEAARAIHEFDPG